MKEVGLGLRQYEVRSFTTNEYGCRLSNVTVMLVRVFTIGVPMVRFDGCKRQPRLLWRNVATGELRTRRMVMRGDGKRGATYVKVARR